MIKEIVFDEIKNQGERRTDGFVHVAVKADGSDHKIPVIRVTGTSDGPVLLVDACTHGDEYEGTEAILQMADKLSNMDFAGTFIGVPALNLDAFAFSQRDSIVDSVNLNRVFPGNTSSYLTQRIANVYINKIVKFCDAVITFHGGGDVLHLEPLVGYAPQADELGKKSFEMAKAFGGKYTWRMQNLPFDGVSLFAYRELNIPTILPEVGSHCSRYHDWEKNVEICAKGIQNILKHLKMISGEIEIDSPAVDMELKYIHAVNGGMHKLKKAVNEPVKEGEVLAEVTSVFGEVIERILAPYDGVLVGYWSIPVIKPGFWSCLYSKIL